MHLNLLTFSQRPSMYFQDAITPHMLVCMRHSGGDATGAPSLLVACINPFPCTLLSRIGLNDIVGWARIKSSTVENFLLFVRPFVLFKRG